VLGSQRTFLAKEMRMSELLEKLKQAITEGDDVAAAAAAEQALKEGAKPLDIVSSAIVPGIHAAGQLWKDNKYFLPDVVMAAEAFNAAMAVVQPKLGAEGAQKTGKVLMGTVAGDMHNLGKSIVIAMLQGAGFEVLDLGVDVPSKTFIDKTAELKPDIVGAGCYMSTTMLEMKDLIAGLKAAGLRDKVKVMVGGVPTSQEFADEVGADAWGKDALDAVAKALQLVGR
jgi:5-methyltetrahydrofolate--homocysteine methyltransferase